MPSQHNLGWDGPVTLRKRLHCSCGEVSTPCPRGLYAFTAYAQTAALRGQFLMLERRVDFDLVHGRNNVRRCQERVQVVSEEVGDAEGYAVSVAGNGTVPLHQASSSPPPDVIVLDLGLPDMDGADDYVTKPGLGELLARLRAVERRSGHTTTGGVIPTGNLLIDLAAATVTRDGERVHLTPREWDVLQLLVANRGKLITQRQLLQAVWGPAYKEEMQYLRVYMAQLRRKLETDPCGVGCSAGGFNESGRSRW